jgi:hypothetical protein
MTRRMKKAIWPEIVTLEEQEGSTGVIIGDSRQFIEDWLTENITGRWYTVCHYKSTDYYFTNSSEATVFRLRWA